MVEPTQRVGLSQGEKVTCAPTWIINLFPAEVLGIQECTEIHESLDIPPSGFSRAGRKV